MARSELIKLAGTDRESLYFDCPGCGFAHVVSVFGRDRPVWTWNGDLDRPTLSPSVLCQYDWGPDHEKRVCHSFVRDGQIQYLSDSTHQFSGQTVDLPDLDEEDSDVGTSNPNSDQT